MRKTALITGASKGIGKEMAFLFAEKDCNMVLVARSEDRLMRLKEQLEAKYAVSVHIIVKDLSLSGAAQELFNELKDPGSAMRR